MPGHTLVWCSWKFHQKCMIPIRRIYIIYFPLCFMKRTGMSVPAGGRFDRVDALRGVAMLWMTAFHFCFDLSYFGNGAQDFRADPF